MPFLAVICTKPWISMQQSCNPSISLSPMRFFNSLSFLSLSMPSSGARGLSPIKLCKLEAVPLSPAG